MALVKKSPQKKVASRKSQTLIQSPTVKRVLSTPVTIQGWLQKRGSDGLMLWKKRWFVLSDYCLFYYKDSEEEKLLGSLILASYIISPCTNEDKVYKKYSFKAEHSNMRTYYFAADNDVFMAQWVKALTLASLLQETPRPAAKVSNVQYKDDQNQYGEFRGGSDGNSNSCDNQPLYANAPPKPKRLNDCSPELPHAPVEWSTPKYPISYYKHSVQPLQGPGRQKAVQMYPVPTTSKQYQRNEDYEIDHYDRLRVYPTSRKHPPRPHSVDFLDYENKKARAAAEKEPKNIALPQRPKSSLSILPPKEENLDSLHWSEESYAKQMRQSSVYIRSQIKSPDLVARASRKPNLLNQNGYSDSHSDSNHQGSTTSHDSTMLFQRSASARLVDMRNDEQCGPTLESKKMQQKEESMKHLIEWKQRRMLQSPVSQLSKDPMLPLDVSILNPVQTSPNKEMYLKETAIKYFVEEGAAKPIQTATQQAQVKQPLKFTLDQAHCNRISDIDDYCKKEEPINLNQSVSDLDLGYVDSFFVESSRKNYHENLVSPISANPKRLERMNGSNQINAQIQEKRIYSNSAEALNVIVSPQKKVNETVPGFLPHDLKVDEEWGLKLDESRVIKEFSYHYIKSGEGLRPDREMDSLLKGNLKSRIKSQKVNNEEIKNIASFSDLAQPLERVVRSRKEFNGTLDSKQNDWGEDYMKYSDKRQVLSDTETLLYDTSSDIEEKVQRSQISSDDDRDEEVAAVLGKQRVTAAKLEELTPSHPTFQQNLSVSTDVSSTILEENYMPMTPRKRATSSPKELESTEHDTEECPYVEMTQSGREKSKRRSLDSNLKEVKEFDLESSTYIDISMGKNSHYDLVYNEMKAQEPLYMEVKDKDTENNPLERKDEECRALPDILSATAPSFNHNVGRSDSSDADDEASKDLDSIDAPRHPRFSLSDTFRPASYYLGSSLSERTIVAMNSDHPDSSDSDLVSPPPIPASSPPLDDLDTSIESTIVKEISPSVSKESFHSFKTKKINDVLDGSSEEESVKSSKPEMFLKRRPLSADILSSLHEINLNPHLSGKSSSDIESIDIEKSKLFTDERYYGQAELKISNPNQYNFRYNKDMDDNLHNDMKQYYLQMPQVSSSTDMKEDRMSAYPYKFLKEINDNNMDGPNLAGDDFSGYINGNFHLLNKDQQKNAPYYYSDLLRLDSRNNVSKKGIENLYTAAYIPEEQVHYYNQETRYPMKMGRPKMESPTDHDRLEAHKRSRSLEGIVDSKTDARDYSLSQSINNVLMYSQNDGLRINQYQLQDQWNESWKEDSRKPPVRHSRSLEDLDKKIETHSQQAQYKEAVYVNSEFSRRANELAEQRASMENEREKIRKWDMMSTPSATLAIPPNSTLTSPPLAQTTPYGTKSPIRNYNNYAAGVIHAKDTPTPPQHQIIVIPHENQRNPWNIKLSAGELLGRTHEELVLLLIQLRRQRAGVCKAMEKCHREIEAQACLIDYEPANRVENLQRLEELKSKLIGLEKQYEKGKPLVNLVDNMVKLGSLYQGGSQTVPVQKLEFNHKVQEERILADERRDWERIRPDHQDLQAKVEQLYRLDKLLQEESGTLHSLQEDKGILERALGGLKTKLQGVHGSTAETEWYRRQQRLLERELSRVRSILALNSKKLEETVAENARLEQELVVLRQKLQISRRVMEPGGTTTTALESELCRVQLLVGNLLRQRQELSLQVRQLTEKSHSLSQQIWPSSPTVANAKKKQASSGWIETDLDADISSHSETSHRDRSSSICPLYVNTETVVQKTEMGYEDGQEDYVSPLLGPEFYQPVENEDETIKQAFGSAWKEKSQEIKTVRIVKRESERRQRDRDRSGNIGIPVSKDNYACIKRTIPEEDHNFNTLEDIKKNENDLPDDVSNFIGVEPPPPPPPKPGPRSDSVNAVWNIVRKNKMKGNLISGTQEKEETSDSPQLSPVYLSEAARKIVEEVAWQGKGEKRLIPKEKRRHHTVSGPSLSAPKNLYPQKGSRDDLDMERVLRPRLTTPDVVRSTLNRTDPNFTKETIDKLLGAPGKILIPERYIPESQPQLSKEELQKRLKKADAIRRMLCETATVTSKDTEMKKKPSTLKYKVEEEKRNKEHLLQLSQILAQEVMEKSKIVAVQALASLPEESFIEEEFSDSDLSPTSSLPLYQQRENFFS